MGYMRHHAIIVTSWNAALLLKARHEAKRIFTGSVSEIYPGVTNTEDSFFVPPDGSKEGWDESNQGNKERDEFISWLASQRYEDDSSPLAWVEVQYGDGDLLTAVIRDSDAAQRMQGLNAD